MADTNDGSKKDAWDKLSSLSGFIAAVLVPIVIAFVGNWYSVALKERETELSKETSRREWVQVGLSILRDANTNDDMRKWAFDIINSNSSVKMPQTTEKIFVTQRAVLPAATQTRIDPAASPTDRLATVNDLQTQAISALLKRDLPGALVAYDQAYKTWPTFRNVDEIQTTLHKLASPPSSDQEWKDLYKKMSAFDLRGVDPGVLAQLKSASGQ